MKLTIITISYNNLEGLKKTFESVFMQSYQDYEYVVIDGGSTDGSKEYIEQNADRISYWVSEPDKGIYNAMNKGIEASNGEYLMFLNSGDELYDINTLEESIEQLHTEDIISGNLNFISDKKNYIGYGQESISFIYFYLNTIWHPSSFIKKEAFQRTTMYDETLRICSDWKWFLLAMYKYKTTYRKIEITISKFYLDGISSQIETQKLIEAERQETFKTHFNFTTTDFEKLDQLYKAGRDYHLLEDKVRSLKNSRLLKILYRLGLFKAYKYL